MGLHPGRSCLIILNCKIIAGQILHCSKCFSIIKFHTMYTDATIEEIDAVMKKSWEAFHQYRKFPLKQRADFMRAIAVEMESLGDELVKIASSETNLPDLRLRNERARTIFQLNSYADACERGEWMELRIDTAIPDRNPPKTD